MTSLSSRDTNEKPTFPPCIFNEGLVGQGNYGWVSRVKWTLPPPPGATETPNQADAPNQGEGESETDEFDAVRVVAIKRIPNYKFNLTTTRRVLREIEILQHFQYCPEIVGCYGMYRHTHRKTGVSDMYLIMDFISSDLHNAVTKKLGIDFNVTRYITCQLLLAMRAMHDQRCIHRDLSIKNVLLSQNADAYVCDFGLSKFFDPDEELSAGVVTQWYRAPEVLMQAPYAFSCDIWSVGVLMAEMLLQDFLFPGKPNDPADQLGRIFAVLPTPTLNIFEEDGSYHHCTPEAKAYLTKLIQRFPQASHFDNLKTHFKNVDGVPAEEMDLAMDVLQKMLKFDPKERPSAEELLQHPYFAEHREFIEAEIENQTYVARPPGEAEDAPRQKRPLFKSCIDNNNTDHQVFIDQLEAMVPEYNPPPSAQATTTLSSTVESTEDISTEEPSASQTPVQQNVPPCTVTEEQSDAQYQQIVKQYYVATALRGLPSEEETRYLAAVAAQRHHISDDDALC